MICWSKNLVPIKSCFCLFVSSTTCSQRQLQDCRHSNQNLGSIFLFKIPFAITDFTTPFHTTPKNKSWKQGRRQVPWPHRFSAFHTPGGASSHYREQTESTRASASVSPQLVPIELGQEAPIAETPNSSSQTFSPLLPLFQFMCC